MTIKDQLNKLPEPYRSLAIRRAKDPKYKRSSLNSNSSCVEYAIHSAFYSTPTPEGFEFWIDVAIWAKYHLDVELPTLPPIPEHINEN